MSRHSMVAAQFAHLPVVRRFAGIMVVLVGLLAGLSAMPAHGLVPSTVDKKVWGTDGRVMSIVETPDAVFIGGDFANLVGPDGELVPRANLAALDPATGAPLPWTANAAGSVWGLALSPDRSTLYLGGQFTGINGVDSKPSRRRQHLDRCCHRLQPERRRPSPLGGRDRQRCLCRW